MSLQFGGLLINAGSQPTAVSLPNTVEILKPAPMSPADVTDGMQVIASGPVRADGTVLASVVRITGRARPDR